MADDRRALDTNVYIKAVRDPVALRRLKRYLIRIGGRLHVSAVVALELRAGAARPAQWRAVEDMLAAYVSRDRLLVPSFDAFVQTGRVLSTLATRERFGPAQAPRSFTNDVLLAASCRESSAVLVTHNVRDFGLVQRHMSGFRFVDAASELA